MARVAKTKELKKRHRAKRASFFVQFWKPRLPCERLSFQRVTRGFAITASRRGWPK